MNIRNEILKEHSRKQAEKIARYALSDNSRFKELFKLFCSDEYRVAQRAAYALNVCHDKNPAILRPYLDQLLKNLAKPNTHDAIRRNTMRVLQNMDIPLKYQGRVVEAAFTLLADRGQAIAIRAFAMTVIFNLSKQHPDLQRELALLIENELDEQPKAAIKSRGTKILKAINKQ